MASPFRPDRDGFAGPVYSGELLGGVRAQGVHIVGEGVDGVGGAGHLAGEFIGTAGDLGASVSGLLACAGDLVDGVADVLGGFAALVDASASCTVADPTLLALSRALETSSLRLFRAAM